MKESMTTFYSGFLKIETCLNDASPLTYNMQCLPRIDGFTQLDLDNQIRSMLHISGPQSIIYYVLDPGPSFCSGPCFIVVYLQKKYLTVAGFTFIIVFTNLDQGIRKRRLYLLVAFLHITRRQTNLFDCKVKLNMEILRLCLLVFFGILGGE